jgi:CAAX protease family protein
MDLRGLVKRYPLQAYCALTFAISWGWILAVVAPSGFPVQPDRFEQLMLFVYPAMFVGPAVAGLLLTGLVSGRAGLRVLRSQLFNWRVGMRWYLAALLTAPIVILAVLIVLSVLSSDFMPLLYVSDDKVFLVVYPVVAGAATALFEEVGWTGFATTTMLQRHHGVLRTGIAVGVLFATWNVLVVAWSGAAQGTLSPMIFLPIALFTWLPAYRVLVVWVYHRTDSLLIAMLMSASLWAAWISLTPQASLAGAPLAVFYLVFTAVLWAVIGGVVAANRRPVAAAAGAGSRPSA